MTGPHRTTGAEIEQLLSDAEAILSSTVRQRRRLSAMAGSVYLISASVLIGATALAVRLPRETGRLTAVLLAVIALAALAWTTVRATGQRRHIRHQEQKMITMVDRIRGVLPLVAQREQWETSRVQAIRARVSRFPIVAG